jgi:hypothetical protein
MPDLTTITAERRRFPATLTKQIISGDQIIFAPAREPPVWGLSSNRCKKTVIMAKSGCRTRPTI